MHKRLGVSSFAKILTIMVAGYWLFDALLLRSFAGSAAGIPSNLVQAGFGVAVSVFLAAALRKSGYVRSKFSNL